MLASLQLKIEIYQTKRDPKKSLKKDRTRTFNKVGKTTKMY